MSPSVTIAVDGPAASGKTTLAHHLADHFGFAFLDTGLLYRAVAKRLLDRNADPADNPAAVLEATALQADEIVAERLRGEAIGQAASQVAAFPAVRNVLLPFQRSYARREPGAVLAGRDIGTVVCPGAEIKLFVTASVEERARRRHEELQRRGERPIYARVLDELVERDRRDAERSVAPLSVAQDAWTLDTTNLNAQAAFEAARSHIAERLGANGAKPLASRA